MAALVLLSRSGLRGRWRALVALTLLTAVSCGFVLTAANGARRAHTAWARLTAETDYPDGLLSVPMGGVDAAEATVRSDPTVVGSGAFTWIPANPEGFDQEIGMFAGIGPGFGAEVVLPLIEQGRRPDLSRVDEITVNQPYADLVGVDVGSVVHLVGPSGLEQDATVVGIHRSPLDVGPNGDAPSALGSPALVANWLPTLSEVAGFDELRPAIAVRFAEGTDEDNALQALADEIPEAGAVTRAGLDADVRDGISASTTAYAVLATAAAAATILLLGFLLAGAVGGTAQDPRLLAALGATRGTRALAAAVPTALATIAGVAIAPIGAIAGSPLVRTGFTAAADPTRGVWFEPGWLLLATLALTVVTFLILGAASWRATSARAWRPPGSLRPSRISRSLTASPPAELGALAALGKMRPATQRLSRSTLIAVGISILGGVASLSWRASATELERDFRLQGWSFDADARATTDASDEAYNAARDRLVGDEGTVAAVTSYWQTTVPFRGTDTDVFALTEERGELDLALIEGRAPDGPGEVVLGPLLLRQAGLEVGDELQLPAADGAVRTEIVGEAVFPLIGNTGFGAEVLTDPATATSLGAEPLNRGFLVDLAPDADTADLQDLAGDAVDVSAPWSPPPIQRLLDAVGTDTVLILFFAAFGIAVFAFGLVTATRRQRLDYAVARAVGFRRRQVIHSFVWQAVITLAVAGLVAVPAGVALGRTVWRVSTDHLGIMDAYAVEPAAAVLWVGGAVIAFTLIAVATAVPLVRATVASGLRSE